MFLFKSRKSERGLLFIASLAAGIANYAFGLLCVHWLGSRTYADIAAVTSVSMILTVPLAGLQAAYSRDISMAIGKEDWQSYSGLKQYGIKQIVKTQIIVFLLGVLLAPALHFWAGVSDYRIAFTLPLLTLGATAVPILSGFLQGGEHYAALSAVMSVGGVLRFLLAPLGILVAGAVGAINAGVVAALLATLTTYLLVKPIWRERLVKETYISVAPKTTTIASIALIAYAVISNADLVISPMIFSNEVAGNYAAATIAGRGVAFIATTISLILLTSTARRISQGADTWAPLIKTVKLVSSLGIILSLVCLLIPAELYNFVFGTTQDVRLLVSVSVLALSGAGLVNNLLNYALAHHVRWYVYSVLGLSILYVATSSVLVESVVQLALTLLLSVLACVALFFLRIHKDKKVTV